MAMETIPLLRPTGLPPMPSGVEFFVVECENATPIGDDTQPEPAFRACTVLVSFATDAAERAQFRPLLTALSFGHASSDVCSGEDRLQKLPERLLACLESAGHDLVTVAVYVGSSAAVAAETVQPAVDALRRCFGMSLTALVVVATTTHQFASLRGVDGFVCGVHATSAETARDVFLLLSTLTAPRHLTGIDVLDLLPVLGSAQAPSRIAQGFWFREGDGRLVFATQADRHRVQGAARVLAVSLVHSLQWSEMHRLHRAVRAEAVTASACILFAPCDALRPGLLPISVGMVPVLCAPTQTRSKN